MVIFPESSWQHANERLHLVDLGGSWTSAITTVTKPDLIIENPQIGGLVRTAIERYVRFDNRLNQHVIVPMKVLQTDEKLPGYTAKAGSRLATTVFASQDVPKAPVIWSKT